ncbi:MAG: hypothetical protein QNK11_05530 [Legionella sp.]|nr:hypothetical protein [Legionella sp.]
MVSLYRAMTITVDQQDVIFNNVLTSTHVSSEQKIKAYEYLKHELIQEIDAYMLKKENKPKSLQKAGALKQKLLDDDFKGFFQTLAVHQKSRRSQTESSLSAHLAVGFRHAAEAFCVNVLPTKVLWESRGRHEHKVLPKKILSDGLKATKKASKQLQDARNDIQSNLYEEKNKQIKNKEFKAKRVNPKLTSGKKNQNTKIAKTYKQEIREAKKDRMKTFKNLKSELEKDMKKNLPSIKEESPKQSSPRKG